MKSLTVIQKKILNRMLDRYENSKTYTGENRVNQTFRLKISEVWPAYLDDFTDVSEIEELERQIDELKEKELIFVRRRKNGEMEALEANGQKLKEFYRLLGRKEKKLLLDEEIHMYQEYAAENTVLGAFSRKQVELISKGKKAQYKKERAENYLKLLKRILENDTELYERELSVRVLGDTKLFETSYRRSICKILRSYGNYEDVLAGEDEETIIERIILEEHNIISNPGYVYFKGAACVHLKDGTILKIKEELPMALSSEFLNEVDVICPTEKKILTIENLTTFHRFDKKGYFCIYLAGYHSLRITQYLKKIDDPEQREWLHFGDADPDGFMILRNLINKTGLKFEAYRMGIKVLQQYYANAKKLETGDRKKLITLLSEDFYPEVMQYMLENDCKLEQEAIL